MASKKNRSAQRKGNIRSNHQARKGPMMIYVLLFVVVSILMITLNQTRKRNSGNSRNVENTRSSNPDQFTKEGELDFLNAQGDIISSIEIEIADDDLQTQRGLMYRRSMKQNRGMLFIFPDEEERSFWMKNTLISLDILYVNADKEIVSISENAPTKSEQSIWSEAPAKYVVEVNAGYVAQYGIAVGDKIQFKRTY
jgi:uncharacterized membrane protein (UPF0127 family)